MFFEAAVQHFFFFPSPVWITASLKCFLTSANVAQPGRWKCAFQQVTKALPWSFTPLLACVLVPFSLSAKHLKLHKANPLLMSLHRQRGSARSPFCERRAGAPKPSGRSMNIWSSECFTSGFGPPLPLHFLIKRGFAFWLSWPLSPSVTLLLSGKEPNCHFVLQVCGGPGSMAWAVRTLHQRTRVMTIDLLSVAGVFGSHFSIWKQGLFHCCFTLFIELTRAANEISGIALNRAILPSNNGEMLFVFVCMLTI